MNLSLTNVRLPLDNFTLEVEVEARGKVTVLFGPSGSGKTTLLEIVSGLRQPDSARIILDGEILTDTSQGIHRPSRLRNMGYVPQDLALFPHLTVKQNLAYGQKLGHHHQKLPDFDRTIEILEIQHLVNRGIGELSGGEKQRVALARALLASPKILLLDEPLASLDEPLRRRILPFFWKIRDELQIPMIYVTHDRDEALALADQVAILDQGKIIRSGTAGEIFNQPVTGSAKAGQQHESIQPGIIMAMEGGLVTVQVGTALLTALESESLKVGLDVYVCIRGEDVVLMKSDGPGSARNHLAGMLKTASIESSQVNLELDCGFPLRALLTRKAYQELGLEPGDKIVALIKAPKIHLVPH